VLYTAVQVKNGGKEVFAGAMKLPSDWYTRHDPIRGPIYLRDISTSGVLRNTEVDTERHNFSRSPVVPVEVCVLRIRSSRLHEGAAGVTTSSASPARCIMAQQRPQQSLLAICLSFLSLELKGIKDRR
jgi:hypothetical protein